MSELNYDEWLLDYKKNNESANYMSRRDLKKAYQKALDTKAANKLAEREKKEAEELLRKQKLERAAEERQKDDSLAKYITHLKHRVQTTDHYVTIPSIGEMEEVYEALLTIPLDELKPLQREFLALIPKIEGRTDYLNARNSLIYRNLLLEQNNLLNTALSVNPGASVGNAGNMMNATHVIAAGALLTNQSLRNIGEDVENISEGFGFDE